MDVFVSSLEGNVSVSVSVCELVHSRVYRRKVYQYSACRDASHGPCLMMVSECICVFEGC